MDCIFLGSSYDLSCYSREGSLVDFSRLPLEAAWGRATLNPAVVANSKIIARPVHGGPGGPSGSGSAPGAGSRCLAKAP